jgi:hypothetical protein
MLKLWPLTMPNTYDKKILNNNVMAKFKFIKFEELKEDDVVFLSRTESSWPYPFVRKRNHTPETRSAVLCSIFVLIILL